MLLAGFIPNQARSLTLEELPELERQAYQQQLNQWQREYQEEQDKQKKIAELTEKANQLKGKYGGTCVKFAQNFLGVTNTRWTTDGFARTIEDNTSTPVIGAVVLTRESGYGHAAVLISVTETTITFVESNYIRNTIGIRTLSIRDKRIKGYKIIY